MSKSVLLLGGSGFLGSAMQKTFAEDPQYDVSFSSTRGDPSDPRHVKLDLLKESDAKKASEFDVIVNLTGQVSGGTSKCLDLNITGMQNLLDAVQEGRQTVVQISSVQVYGPARTVTETSPLRPDLSYGEAKMKAELLLHQRLSEERFLIARLCNLYGPGQEKGLLWYLIDCIKNGRGIEVKDNNGELFRHFLHVEDAARILHDLIACDARGVVNVAGPEAYTIKQLVALSERIVGRALPADYKGGEPAGNIHAISTEKLETLVRPQYRHTMEEYLRKQLL